MTKKPYSPEKYQKTRHLHRIRMVKWRHGVTKAQVEAMAEAQGYRCAICQTSYPDPWRMNIDHHHASGTFRGLLCARCNVALGVVESKPFMAAARAYLLATGSDVPT